MEHLVSLSFIFSIAIPMLISTCRAMDCETPPKTITVDQWGQGNFTTIQSAIDSVPSNNSRWIHIKIYSGSYREKVNIVPEKRCIFLEGASQKSTNISWDDHGEISMSATFTSSADNFVAKGITFENTYNLPGRHPNKQVLPALAMSVRGDKSAFLGCGFLGVQDTLWDENGRHYFHRCYIQGSVDFIFGNAQSRYEECVINATGLSITAQARNSPEDPSGYVFKNCVITGNGVHNALLGRAYRAYSRVVIADSKLSDAVSPKGWSSWNQAGHEANITYVEAGNSGPGADKSERVQWLKNLSEEKLSQFLSMSFIDQDGWIRKLPVAIP